ncbi:MAG: DUF1232 domain-containing protein [Deltaproteobacteria bacterium]|nr:DUF1232 domain-containing protein [Deltaproteobacteria bacterium]
MLFDLLNQMNARIDDLDPEQAWPAFANQLRVTNPQMLYDLMGDDTQERVSWAAERVSRANLTLIKDIPWYVHALVQAANDPYMEPAYRCAIVGSLAYLVQPHDLIPDDLPGGFGLIDDCILLHVTAAESLEYLPRDFTSSERERLLVNLLMQTIPDGRFPEFRAAIAGVRQLIFHLGLLDPMLVEQTTAAMINDPLVAGPAADPSEYRDSTPPPGPDYFAMPTEGLGVAEDGRIFYMFDGGSVTLRSGQVFVDEQPLTLNRTE